GAKIKGPNPGSAWQNFFVLPLALEWHANQAIAIRGGVRAVYYYHHHKQEKAVINSYWTQSQSFGLGFQLYPGWYLDLTSLTNLVQIEFLNIALRKEWQ
ncbi:MAG: hypothetical protein OEZ20_05415, partial [candidate division WOR-3 bacterium]|nr:hypothetical protein [candidate division WOR-3 bacterium]